MMGEPTNPVSELMWLLAEQGEPSAIEAFTKKYPEHRVELLHRVKILRGIKSVRSDGLTSAGSAAEFKPLSHIKELPKEFNWVPIKVGSGLLGVGLVAFLLTSQFTGKTQSVQVQSPSVTQPTPATNSDPMERMYSLPQDRSTKVEPGKLDPGAMQPVPTAEPLALLQRHVTVKADEERLLGVLNEISLQTGLMFQIAPGLADSPLSVDFHDITAEEALREIGQMLNIGFFEQNPGQILIIPNGNTEKR